MPLDKINDSTYRREMWSTFQENTSKRLNETYFTNPFSRMTFKKMVILKFNKFVCDNLIDLVTKTLLTVTFEELVHILECIDSMILSDTANSRS